MEKSFPVIFRIFAGLLCLVSFVFLGAGSVFASVIDGTVSGYAWSDQIGWINFGTTNGDIHVTETKLTGYAWNENKGRINLSPTNGGVGNTGGGALSGYAWSEGSGWINFTGVTIDSSGNFSGIATGDNGVNVNFSCSECNVKTDWRPVGSASGGVGGSGWALPYEATYAPLAVYGVLINNGAAYTNNPAVTLKIQAGSDVKKMIISNSSDFDGEAQEDYTATKTWTLSAGDGAKNVYVRFYTQYGQPSDTVSASIILDTQTPEIKITDIKQKYNPAEDVIFGGTTTEGNVKITILIGGQYGVLSSDSNGQWITTFGKMPVGNYHMELTPENLAGNAGTSVSVDFSVAEDAPLPMVNPPTILERIKTGLEFLVPNLAKPGELQPVPIVIIPKMAPLALKSVWSILPVNVLNQFVLGPLPKDISFLAQKFQGLKNTLEEVGISKVTDLQKLKSANLILPGLTKTIGLSGTEVTAGKFAMPKGVPIAKLTSSAKTKIPSEIVFARVGGGLLDLNIVLSLNNKGQTEQRISTITGKPLQLIVRVDRPAKEVFGYIVFRSSKSSASQSSFLLPLNSLASSSSFAKPDLASDFDISKYALASVEGAPTLNASALIENGPSVEKRLVLSMFEYQDTGSNVYTATVQMPVVAGEYNVITVVDYKDSSLSPKEIKLITVVDPEGYVYEKNGNKETRIGGAVTSLYWLDPETKQYELWPAKDYQQENPQTTDIRGTYSFLVPEGYYYLTVDAPGYLSYDGKPFQVAEGSGVHINIELKTRFWWLSFFDWKTILLIAVILMLLYNFYKDRIRDAVILNKK